MITGAMLSKIRFTLFPLDEHLTMPIWQKDTILLMKIALRNHDPITLEGVKRRIIANPMYSEVLADDWICLMITYLMNTENWSFRDEKTGEASPLI